MFIEVKLIINNAPLTYVYPNNFNTYLTPNHLLFGRQLCYSNTKSAVIRNLTVLSSTTDKINHISNHFWHRWRHEVNVVNLSETQRESKLNINSQKLCCASSWWKGAIVRIKRANAIHKCPVNKLFRIEYSYHDTNQTDKAREQKFRWEATVIGKLERKYEC